MRVAFFYATGSSSLLNILETGYKVDMNSRVSVGGTGVNASSYASVAGLSGKTVAWDGNVANDPFPTMLDPNRWEVTKIKYQTSSFPLGAAINYGISETIAKINALPPDQPFALGGYSQGAAVMSGVYNEIRYGTLTSRASSFLGATMFGNPRRQTNHVGYVGGTWSGAWDIANSSTGGHGCFPSTGTYARLQSCEDKWVEFTAYGDVFSAVGSSTNGNNWVTANSGFFDLTAAQLVTNFTSGMTNSVKTAVDAAFAVANTVNNYVDAAGKAFKIGGYGHTSYPFTPSVDEPFGNKTAYQVALAYLEALAMQWATAPVVVAQNSAAWSTTLLPPSS